MNTSDNRSKSKIAKSLMFKDKPLNSNSGEGNDLKFITILSILFIIAFFCCFITVIHYRLDKQIVEKCTNSFNWCKSIFTHEFCYNERRYVQIAPNETAFLVPLEDDNSCTDLQVLKKFKVDADAKRIRIPCRKMKTGRFTHKWVPTMMVVTVDRTPVTRQWVDQWYYDDLRAAGFEFTFYLNDSKVAKFLYTCGGASLETTSDIFVDYFKKSLYSFHLYNLEKSILENKEENKEDTIQDAIKSTVAYCNRYGVTVTIIARKE